jgi:hypothetical protein
MSMFTEKKPGAPRVALVGCSASKLKKSAPARELYTSALFGAAYAYAEKTCDAILIVSAFYGVVAPKAVIRPYDLSLRKYNKSEREHWGVRTIGQLLPSFVLPPLLVILAGKVYADALLHGAHWHNLPRPELPLTGIRGVGPRVKWLRIESVKAKVAQLLVEQRCHADCPTWCISDTVRGFEIHRCDACWQGAPDPLTDDEAALLPDARARLGELETEPLGTQQDNSNCTEAGDADALRVLSHA